MQIDTNLIHWIMNYLTNRLLFIRLRDRTSDSDQQYGSTTRDYTVPPPHHPVHSRLPVQLGAVSTAIIGFIREEQEGEYRKLVENLVVGCHQNQLQINTLTTKEMVLDFRRTRPSTQLELIDGVEVEVVSSYNYLFLQLDNKFDWSVNSDYLYRMGQTRMTRLAAFNPCK